MGRPGVASAGPEARGIPGASPKDATCVIGVTSPDPVAPCADG
jgi:hypothetical protein